MICGLALGQRVNLLGPIWSRGEKCGLPGAAVENWKAKRIKHDEGDVEIQTELGRSVGAWPTELWQPQSPSGRTETARLRPIRSSVGTEESICRRTGEEVLSRPRFSAQRLSSTPILESDVGTPAPRECEGLHTGLSYVGLWWGNESSWRGLGDCDGWWSA